ncbi:hypothetical protein [Prochlorococcus marinus]|uniref:hypothetical protein n=1 Tax=Prochlorococcus marinus TaxID=1219 RepID=UPI0022B32AA4|nr:hypothetical protein [Prochlorococcus marinus]
MILFLAVFMPIEILRFLYLFFIEKNALPRCMKRASRNSSFLGTYGSHHNHPFLLLIIKFLTTNYNDNLGLD